EDAGAHFLVTPDVDDARQQRNDDDQENDRQQVFVDVVARDQVTEQIPGNRDAARPHNAADDIVGHEAAIGHVADTGDNWREGAHNRDEARQHNRLRTLFLVEFFSAEQIFLLKEGRVLALKQPPTDAPTKHIAHTVTDDRGDATDDAQLRQGERPLKG